MKQMVAPTLWRSIEWDTVMVWIRRSGCDIQGECERERLADPFNPAGKDESTDCSSPEKLKIGLKVNPMTCAFRKVNIAAVEHAAFKAIPTRTKIPEPRSCWHIEWTKARDWPRSRSVRARVRSPACRIPTDANGP